MNSLLQNKQVRLGVVIAAATLLFVLFALLLPHHDSSTAASAPTASDAPTHARKSSRHKGDNPPPAAPAAVGSPASPSLPGTSSAKSGTESSTPAAATPAAGDTSATAPVVVHVAGRVHHPDVYRIPASERVVDAVRLAGGALADADLDAVNLAAHLQDGEQIYVPSKAVEAAAAPSAGRSRASGSRSTGFPSGYIPPAPPGRMPLAGPMTVFTTVGRVRHPRGAGAARTSRTAHSNKLKDPSQGTVNLNTAGPQELELLPGVGPSMAVRILEFRQKNGLFTRIEDVMNVKGIGPAKFAKMRPFIRVR